MPDISVCLITYNHEQFIDQALTGILNQKTSYSFEIVIGEDCSTDKTRQICEAYAARYPGKIKLLPTPENLGAAFNFIRTVDACTGQYFAYCDGDDYWIDENKLQDQVDFLEANSEYILCAGRSGYLDYHGNITYRDERPDQSRFDFTVEDYLLKMSFETATILFRKTKDFKFPDFYRDIFSGDQFLVLMLTMNGKKIRYLDKNLTMYRYHQGGVTKRTHRKEKFDRLFLMLDDFDRFSDYRYHRHVELRKRITLVGWNQAQLNYPKRLIFILFNIGFALRYRKYIPFTWKTCIRYVWPFK